MAYINKDEVKAIRTGLKTDFPRLKFAVRKDGHSGVTVILQKGNIDYSDIIPSTRKNNIPGLYDSLSDNGQKPRDYKAIGNRNASNHEYADHPEIQKMMDVIESAPATVDGGQAWFDKSDSMTDYFHTAFYIDFSIGEWGTPYILAG